jgi:hypothetical protein
VELTWRAIGLAAKPNVRDLWLRQDLKKAKVFTAELPPHGCVLLKAD